MQETNPQAAPPTERLIEEAADKSGRRELLRKAAYSAPMLLGAVELTKQPAFALSHPRRYRR